MSRRPTSANESTAFRPTAGPDDSAGPTVDVHGESPDAELGVALVRARAGDQQAFAVLYRELHPRLLRYAVGLVGQDAEDVTAEAWLQIARDLRTFSGDLDGLRGWTTRVVRNRALDHVRFRARRPADPVEHSVLLDLHAPEDPAGGAEENLGTAEAVALIATLPPEQAEAVMLRVVLGLDSRQAGKVLGKRPGAVRVAAHRGLKRLAQQLEHGHGSAAEQHDE